MIDDIISYLASNKNPDKKELNEMQLSDNKINKIVIRTSELRINFTFNKNICDEYDFQINFKKKMYFINAKIILFNYFENKITYHKEILKVV